MPDTHPYRTIFEQTGEALVVHNLDEGRFELANEAAGELFEIDTDRIGNYRLADFLPEDRPHDGSRARKIAEKVREDGARTIEWRYRTPDGSEFWGETKLSLLQEEPETLILAAVRDVSARREVTDALRESEEKFRKVAENALVGIYLIQDGTFRYVNPKMTEILGTSAEELVHRQGPKDFVHPDDWPTVQEHLRARYEGEVETVPYAFRIVRPDESVRRIENIGTIIQYQGEPAITGTLRDVTEEYQNEQALVEARKEAEAASELTTRMLQSITHELRNPMVAIQGFAEMITDEADGELATYADYIRTSSLRLVGTMNSIVHLSRLETEEESLDLSRFDVRTALREEAGRCKPVADSKELDLRLELPSDPVKARLDETAFRTITRNLVDNAIKYTDTGYVQAALKEESGELRLVVQDTGEGMDSEFQERMYEAFTRRPTGSGEDREGLGLGLNLVRRLVEQLEGTIQVDSTEGEGTRFEVKLPRVHPDESGR